MKTFFTRVRWKIWVILHFGFKKPTQRQLAEEYCRVNPSAKASIQAAGRRLEEKEQAELNSQKAHRFSGSAPWAKCMYCGLARESADFPVCEKWVSPQDIEQAIRDEEALFQKTIARARKIAGGIPRSDLTGKSLAYLHQTHGIGPDVVEFILGDPLPGHLMESYALEYESHKATGLKGQKKTVLVAR